MKAAVVTGSMSLAVSLSLMAGDWEVALVTDPEEVGTEEPHPDVVVLDLGSTEAGILAARALGTNGGRPRVVVLGEIQSSDPAVDVVVVRPFTIEDLVAHLRLPEPTAVASRMSPGWTRSQPSRPPTPVTPVPRLPMTEPDEPPDLDDPPRERSGTPPSLGTPPARPPVDDRVVPARTATSSGAGIDRDGVQDAGSAADMVATEARAAPELGSEGSASVSLADEDATPVDGVAQRTLAFLRRSSQTGGGLDADPSLEARLDAGIRSCRFLEAMLDELPTLATPQDVGGAILDEVLDRFDAEVVAVWALDGDSSYRVIASDRLSSAERRTTLAADQPLLKELAISGHAVLIDPTDMARGLLAGVAGTREESLLAASLLADGELVGALTVGGVGFTPEDAERLQAIAAEASLAAGLAVRLGRLRRSVGSPAHRRDEPGY